MFDARILTLSLALAFALDAGAAAPATASDCVTPETPMPGVAVAIVWVAQPLVPLKVKAFVERARASAPARYLGPDELPYDWADEF